MNDIDKITLFFGWCAVINIVFLCFTTLCLVSFRNLVAPLHSKMLNIDISELPQLYFKFLANYKVSTLIFSIVPYLALKLMS